MLHTVLILLLSDHPSSHSLFQDNMRRSEEKGYAKIWVHFTFDYSFYALNALLSRLPASLQDRDWLSFPISLPELAPVLTLVLTFRAEHQLWTGNVGTAPSPSKVCCSCMRDPSRDADRNRQVGGWSPHSEKRREWPAEIRNAESIVPCWKGWTKSALKSGRCWYLEPKVA